MSRPISTVSSLIRNLKQNNQNYQSILKSYNGIDWCNYIRYIPNKAFILPLLVSDDITLSLVGLSSKTSHFLKNTEYIHLLEGCGVIYPNRLYVSSLNPMCSLDTFDTYGMKFESNEETSLLCISRPTILY